MTFATAAGSETGAPADPLSTSRLLVLGKRVFDEIDYDPAMVLDAVERAYLALGNGESDNPRKLMSQPPEKHSVAYSMLGRDGGRRTVGFKTSYKHDPTHDRGLQKYYTTLLLFDDVTGLPVALMDGSLVGALRTPAVSALIARAAAPHARTALIVGTGTQGRMAAPMLLAALPDIERVIVHGHHDEGILAVRQTLKRFHPQRDIEVSSDLEASARQADIVLGVAGAGAPEAVRHASLKPGALALLVGYGIHADALWHADYRIATSEAQMRVTGTDLADARGEFAPIDAELPDILLGRKPARRSPEQIVFAYNSGMVVTDIALGRLLAEQARAKGLGEEVSLW
ncbi:ornithine cyclodeaminase family protein [Trinickia terrae]|uniref:Ornithine cyclodeaminase family protein n=1 Tax=Trinickia terrae TaxID=2571161 RepID=A0A4U1I8D2_9BURK|nr:ornithine cyclodeaminase family protein [Trinickia terrae]TKC89714.1 ornithine cyclodeaminase family protein [Trinickia terrae]